MLEVRDVSKYFGEGHARVTALDSVSLNVQSHEFCVIMGPSGSGKTTLLNIIGGLDQPSSGQVLLNTTRIDDLVEDRLVDIRRRQLAYVFQQYHLLGSLNALENVMLPLVYGGIRSAAAESMAMLKKVGLADRFNHKPVQLSGGEQQRVAIARALVTLPEIILADEPTGNMDRQTGRDILELFFELNRSGVGIVMVTHDPEIGKLASRKVEMQDGRIIDAGIRLDHAPGGNHAEAEIKLENTVRTEKRRT